jgi:AsmA protein
VDQLLLTAKGKEGNDAFEARLEAPKLSLAADKASGANVNAALKLSGTQRTIDAKIALSGVEGKSQSLQAGKLTLELDARQGETTVKGNLASALAANLEKQTVELPAFSGELNVANPQMPMKSVKLPLTGGLRADIDGQTAAVHANTQFDESKIAAKVNVSRFSPLALGFDLDIDRLNVDKYLPPKPAAAGGKEADKPAAEKPFDFSALKGLNASGTVKIGQLQVSNVKASNVRLEVKAAGGKLDVAPMTANLYDGSLAGALSVNANNNHVAVKQNLANVNINPLMKDALDKDVLEGRGNVALDVATAGTTVTAMKKGLNGAASLNLKDGAIKGINLAKTFRETKAVFTTRKDAMQQAKQTEKTDFSELSATFRIANGVARNDDLSMKSPFIRLGGAGDINIGEDRMDYLAKASVVATAGGQGGKELEHLKGLTVPVRVSGPFDKLAYNIEFGGLVAEAAKAKAEEKVKEKVQEKAGGVLKGLFKK